MSNTRIMPCSNIIRSSRQRSLQKYLKLYFLITHNIWVWRAARLIFANHIIDNVLLIFFLEIKNSKINAQANRHTLGVSNIFRPRTMHSRQILGPVLHIDSCHIVTLLNQKCRGHGGIHAARHPNKNFLTHLDNPRANSPILINSPIANHQPHGVNHHHEFQFLSEATGWLRILTSLNCAENSSCARRI